MDAYNGEAGEVGEIQDTESSLMFGKDISEMTDRELLEELVMLGRQLAGALSDMQSSPMMKTMMKMVGGK